MNNLTDEEKIEMEKLGWKLDDSDSMKYRINPDSKLKTWLNKIFSEPIAIENGPTWDMNLQEVRKKISLRNL